MDFTDPDSRRTYPWGQENRELVEFHKEMIRIHKREKPLRTGSLKMLSWSSNVTLLMQDFRKVNRSLLC